MIVCQAANALEDVVCAVTSSDAVFKLFNVESDAAVVVLKKFDDLRSMKKMISLCQNRLIITR